LAGWRADGQDIMVAVDEAALKELMDAKAAN